MAKEQWQSINYSREQEHEKERTLHSATHLYGNQANPLMRIKQILLPVTAFLGARRPYH